jgi:TonB-dependent starch-binding outer membrane protein SusC
MKKIFFLSGLILVVSISSLAQTKEGLGQDTIKNATIMNTSVANSQTNSKSIQIKPSKFDQVSLNGPRIIVIDGKVSEQGFDKIEPNDIHSINVVNNEKAASLYGYKDRSAVIIVTTKKNANAAKVENELNKK